VVVLGQEIRSKRFYNDLFGWKIDKSPEANTAKGMENWMVTTTDHNGNEALAAGNVKKTDATAASN